MKIHFIGIGGIGVSALATYCLKKGADVSGCDLVRSETTDVLKKLGVHIRIGPPRADCVPAGTDRIIYSPAVPKTHPELEIRNLSLEILSYPEALGELTKKHFTIAVAGTHGKSTTTAMLGFLLMKAGFDPTIIVGTKLKELGGLNCRVAASEGRASPASGRGKSKYLVIEADEHFASFLNYWPQIAVLTSVEADHLDYYKNLKNLITAFKTFISHVSQNGWLVANKDDVHIKKIIDSINLTAVKNIRLFSAKQKEAKLLKKILKIPGEHNVSNALAALTVARILKIPDKISYQTLSQYKGSWRRFEVLRLSKPKPYTLVSDYGHHPTEIKATLQAAREKWPLDPARGRPKKIWLVFQPHQYARTYYLWDAFVSALSQLPVDKLVLTDIYDVAGRENKAIKNKVSSKKLAQAIRNLKLKIKNYDVVYVPTAENVKQYLRKNIHGGEVVIVMGAGDIYERLTLRLTQGKHHLTRHNGKEKIDQ